MQCSDKFIVERKLHGNDECNVNGVVCDVDECIIDKASCNGEYIVNENICDGN